MIGAQTATVSPLALWYLTRGTGIVALVLLTATLVLGIVSTAGWATISWPRFVTQGLHRNLSLLGVVLIVIHVLSAIVDGFAPIGLIDMILPFHSPYRPVWLGLGTLAFDLMLAAVITSLLRHRIGYTAWRAVHWLAYACWPIALLHGLGTGTDTHVSFVLLLNVACVVPVVAALGWRLTLGWPRRAALRVGAGATTVVALVGVIVFTAWGPLQPGWARRAGTPASLFAKVSVSAAVPAGRPGRAQAAGAGSTGAAGRAASASPDGLPSGMFRSTFSGTVTTAGPDTNGRITVRIDGSVQAGGTVDITLWGIGDGEGGVAMQSSRVAAGKATGTVTSLDGDRMVVTLTEPGGGTRNLGIVVSLDSESGTFTGTIDTVPAGTGSGGNG